MRLLLQHWRSWHSCGWIVGRRQELTLGLAQGWFVDVNRLAVVSQAAEQGVGQIFIAKQARLGRSVRRPWTETFGHAGRSLLLILSRRPTFPQARH